MNTEHRHPANPIDEAIDEREWQLQERARRELQLGVAGGDEPRLAGYRQVAQALRQPLADPLPADFARDLAALAAASYAAPDTRLEQVLTRALLTLLALSAAVVAALYGGQWLQATAAALPMAAAGASPHWLLALGACLALTWSLPRWRDRPGAGLR